MPNLTHRFTHSLNQCGKRRGRTRVPVIVFTHSHAFKHLQLPWAKHDSTSINHTLEILFSLAKTSRSRKRKENHKLFITTTTTTMNDLTNPSFFEPSASDKMPPVSNSHLCIGFWESWTLCSRSLRPQKNFHKFT